MSQGDSSSAVTFCDPRQKAMSQSSCRHLNGNPVLASRVRGIAMTFRKLQPPFFGHTSHELQVKCALSASQKMVEMANGKTPPMTWSQLVKHVKQHHGVKPS